MAGDYLLNRDGIWHFSRRVPGSLAGLDQRRFVRQSTKIRVADDPKAKKAQRVADRINDELERYWKALVDGRSADAQARYDAARERARGYGFDYLKDDALAERPLEELVDRVLAHAEAPPELEEADADSLLGKVPEPKLMLSALFIEFDALMKTANLGMSADQLRKWANPKKLALSNLIEVVGDRPLADLSRNNVLDFRAWLESRVVNEGIEIGTANKQFSHLNTMFKTVVRAKRLSLDPVFSEMRIGGETTGQRTAFLPSYIQDVLLKDGALDMLNAEARRVLYLMSETGLRLSEACNLTANTIHLGHPVPHIQVRPDGRRMKTDQSERDIPLVGVALMAMREQPNGFPRYRHKSDSLSKIVNKTLGENGLLPTDNHSAYSFRHAFEDRLTKVEAPEKMISELMGHKFHRPRYGLGHELEHKLEWLQRIAFRPPGRV